jgi:hypothetical protein
VVSSLLAAGVLLVLASAFATGAAALSSDKGGVHLSFSVEGRRHEIDAFGALRRSDSGPVRVTSISLQQRVSVHGQRRWKTRSTAKLTRRGDRVTFVARWRHPPPKKRFAVRALALMGRRVVARSPVKAVLSGDPGTVFYSGECNAGAGEATGAVLRLTAGGGGRCDFENRYDGVWTRPGGKCDTSNASAFPSEINGQAITELSGYSLGRLGPLYFLKNAPSWTSQIHYILLFDPGNASNLSGCDANKDIDPATHLADWLARDDQNRLVIMGGTLTAENDHAGIKERYFSKLSEATATTQVLVCDTHASHDGVIKGYSWMVGAEAPIGCPGFSEQWIVPGLPLKPLKPIQPLPNPGSAPAPAPLPAGEYYVQNADGGVYWRLGPDWNTAEVVPGVGFYPGTVIKPSCYASGAANVPGTSNNVWEQASWVGGPGGGSGWISEHFIEDRAPLGQPSPGVPPCNSPPPDSPPNSTRIDLYNNYGGGAEGHAMCRGNPARPESMPGGVATETFSVPPNVGSVDSALVQIDPDASVTAHATLSVNGVARGSADAAAAGDTTFSFPAIAVQPGDSLSLSISFSATYGKIITVYTVGSPGGTFNASNSCPDGAPSVSTSSGLRAVISGWTP